MGTHQGGRKSGWDGGEGGGCLRVDKRVVKVVLAGVA